MLKVIGAVIVLSGLVASQCPPFMQDPLPRCEQRTDHELCILAAHKDSDRLADFEFIDIMDIRHADPLACKLRMSAIRQHVMYHGRLGHGSLECHRAAAIFQTNLIANLSMHELCESIGFGKCQSNCKNGGAPSIQPNGTCSCHCSGAWAGRDCSECSLMSASCLNGGTAISTHDQCECNCTYPYTGVHCEVCNRRCVHGSSNPTDPRCKCQCQAPWTGPDCDQCDLRCQHGGKKWQSPSECRCRCNPLAVGPLCETCTARCLNGGILDKKTCTCKCVGGFTGNQCEFCNVTCHHNGTFDAQTCGCHCTNPWTTGQQCELCRNDCHGRGREVLCSCVDCKGYWSGIACHNCTLNCVNEGELDPIMCKCACKPGQCVHGTPKDDCSCNCNGFWRGERCSECHLNCVHGKLNRDTCTCACDGDFTGPKCDQCLKNCTGRGVLDASKCMCTDCISPYSGIDCATFCPKVCRHGSVLNSEACVCEKCPLPWMGAQCDSCKLLLNSTAAGPCGKHGTFDPINCQCVCKEGWTGERCNRCSRQCAHGTLNPVDCSCSCDAHWVGINCSECSLHCQNGGVLDSKNCYCECDRMHSGTQCQGGPCFMQQACDSCLSISDGCEWCAGTASCSKVPGPNAFSTCQGPKRTGVCPTYGECRLCDYSRDELAWLALNGVKREPCDDKLGMPEGRDNLDIHASDIHILCNAARGETWCEAKRICVQDWVGGENGPCHIVDSAPVEERIALNGFIGGYHDSDFKN